MVLALEKLSITNIWTILEDSRIGLVPERGRKYAQSTVIRHVSSPHIITTGRSWSTLLPSKMPEMDTVV